MLIPRFFLRASTIAGAAALAAGAAVPASGAVTPPWRVVKTFGPAAGVWSENLAASGAGNAWSTWTACGPCSPTETIQFHLVHSAGGGWTPQAVPSALASTAQATESIGTSSASNLWLFSGSGASARALRWNGSSWHLQTLPSWVVRTNLSGTTSIVTPVFGPASAWVFSLGQDAISSPSHYAARWNGSSWAKVTLPGVPSEVSVVSPSDIWVLGSPPQALSKSILMHWNGSAWRTVSVPAVKPPSGAIEFVRDLAAAGPGNVWLQRDIEQGSSGATTLYLLHWNGTSWTKVTPGFPTSLVDYLAPDGNGGIWMAANGPAPAYQWRFYHDSSGHWSMSAVPAAAGTSVLDVIGLAHIPGTHSLWAAANLSGSGNTIDGAILKYGP